MRTIIILILIGLFIALFAQPEIIDEIKQLSSDRYYENYYLPKAMISQKISDEFKSDYIAKTRSITDGNKKKEKINTTFLSMALSDYNIVESMYLKRININAIDEFAKIGVDVFDYLIDDPSIENGYNNQGIAEEYFNSGFIFTATVIDSTHSKESYKRTYDNNEFILSNYYVNYKLKLDTVIKGEYLFDIIPEFINLKALYGVDDYILIEDDYNKNNIGKYKRILNDNLLEVNLHEGSNVLIFKNVNTGKIHIDSFINGELIAESTNILYENSNNSERVFKHFESLNDIIRFLKKLEEINDTPNFYNRSYK